MAAKIYDHIDLRVRNLAQARPFYDRFCKALGFQHDYAGEGHHVYFRRVERVVAEALAVIEDTEHVPSKTRIAFRADSREEVDRLAAAAREAGGAGFEEPCDCPEYSPRYYAAFFRDPSGNHLEVCYR